MCTCMLQRSNSFALFKRQLFNKSIAKNVRERALEISAITLMDDYDCSLNFIGRPLTLTLPLFAFY